MVTLGSAISWTLSPTLDPFGDLSFFLRAEDTFGETALPGLLVLSTGVESLVPNPLGLVPLRLIPLFVSFVEGRLGDSSFICSNKERGESRQVRASRLLFSPICKRGWFRFCSTLGKESGLDFFSSGLTTVALLTSLLKTECLQSSSVSYGCV